MQTYILISDEFQNPQIYARNEALHDIAMWSRTGSQLPVKSTTKLRQCESYLPTASHV